MKNGLKWREVGLFRVFHKRKFHWVNFHFQIFFTFHVKICQNIGEISFNLSNVRSTYQFWPESVSSLPNTFGTTLLERYLLAVMYFALEGANWFLPHPFLETDTHACDWRFISCTNSSTIRSIKLNGNNANGTIPSELQHFASLGK